MADNLEIFGETYPNATGIKAKDTNGVTQTFVKPSGTVNITSSGTTDVSAYANASVAAGAVTAPSTISGTSATVSTGTNTLTLSKTVSVTPNVTTAGYISSGTAGNASVSLTASVNTRNSSSLSASGATVTAPAGYYASDASKAVASGSATAPASISGTSATVSTGTNTLTLSKTVSVTPTVSAGYVSSGTAGNSSVSLTASVTTKGATTYHPSTSDQTIASGSYTTGAQTIKGVLLTNLTAGNIKKDVVVKVGDSTDDDCVTSITGTYEGSGGGTTEAEEKDVNFIDYDGTIVYSYTAVEAQALSTLPQNPTHSGLTSQGWNWTLTQIKSQLTNIGGKVWVGQMYTTQSGATEIDIELYGELRLTPYLALGINGSVDIDWGDGSAHSTATGSSLTTAVKTPHTYSTNGKYTIKITANSGTYTFFAATTYRFFGDNQSGSGKDDLYISSVKAIRIGSSVPSLGEYAFNSARQLEYVTIPSTVTAYGRNTFGTLYKTKAITIPSGISSLVQYLFTGSYNTKYISIPYSVTEIGQYAFNANYSLRSITLPSGITALGASVFLSCSMLATSFCLPSISSLPQSLFSSCSSIEKIVVPSSVSEINASVFGNCYGLKELHIEASSPPTLSNVNAINATATDLVIYVPYSADHSILNSYKTASNWSSFSSKMQEESA